MSFLLVLVPGADWAYAIAAGLREQSVLPAVTGLLTVLFSGRRWVTALGAFILSLAPGWFGVLVALRVASGG